MDLPQSNGVVDGLEDPIAMLNRLAETDVDGFIINPGLFRYMHDEKFYGKKWIMRVSVGASKFSAVWKPVHGTFVSKEIVNRYGADAVVMMLILGDDDYDSIQEAAKAIDYYHSLSIPVVLEVLASDVHKLHDPDLQRTGARIGAEIGADVMKVFFTEKFEEVIQGCPIPVILAGGAKGEHILENAKYAVSAGAKGFAFGRNIFQHPHPGQIVHELNQILRG